jgi:acetyl-CoA C-acetyltransferase
LALEGHQRAIAARDRGFFADLILPLDGIDKDHFPRRDTSMESLARLKPVFDRTSGRGTLTAGNWRGMAWRFDDIALWEIHDAFSAQVLRHIKTLEDKAFVRAKAGVEHTFGSFPRARMNPNGGSVALGHPFATTGARILSQALKELVALPQGSRAIVSICSDGDLGTVALLQR